MTAITIYSVPPLTSALFLFSLAVVTLVSTGRDRLWLLFAGFCMVMGLSSLFGFLIEITHDDNLINFVRLEIFFALTALTFANMYGIGLTGFRFGGPEKHRRVIRIFAASALVLWATALAMLFLTDWVLATVEKAPAHGVKLTYGPAMWVLLGLYFLGTIRNLVFLLDAYRKAVHRVFREFVGLNLLAFHSVFAPAIWLLFILPIFGLQTQVLAFLAFPASVLIFYVAIVRYQFARVRELNVTLEQKVEERTEALRQTQARLAQSERIASLGQLVAGVAHEMNNPLGAVRSMATTVTRAAGKLKEQVSGKGIDVQQMNTTIDIVDSAGKVILDGTDRVSRVVDDLKRFARLDEADLQLTDINKEMEDAIDILEHSLKPGVTIESDLTPVPTLLCYPAQLNQVVLNLFVNATEAIDDKGTIRLETSCDEQSVRIAVADSGRGIPQENINRVFDPGFTTKGRGVGTGLGLAICHQIVNDHGGTIRLDSHVGKGTTVTIDLPRGGPEAQRR